MANGYRWRTRIGAFFIVFKRGEWRLFFEDEEFDGPYGSPQRALDDLAGGHSAFPSSGHDPSKLGIPDDIDDWEPIRFS